jgi:hypothetical protein
MRERCGSDAGASRLRYLCSCERGGCLLLRSPLASAMGYDCWADDCPRRRFAALVRCLRVWLLHAAGPFDRFVPVIVALHDGEIVIMAQHDSEKRIAAARQRSQQGRAR